MAGEFVCTPLDQDWFQQQGSIPAGSPGIYDNAEVGPWTEYKRTSSPNAGKEKFYEKAIGSITGENDQF